MCKFYIVVCACHCLKLIFDIGLIICVINLLHMYFFVHPLPLSRNWVCCPVNSVFCASVCHFNLYFLNHNF